MIARLPKAAKTGLICAGVVLLLTSWLVQFAYTSTAEYTDAAITHVPNTLLLRRAVLEYEQFPLWSNTILSGYPFAANPLSGLWYPPTWLAALLPQPYGLNLMVLLHVLAGGLGFYRLMRAEGLEKFPAVLGGLAFGLLPRIWAHYAAGHLTLVCAFAWTPWLLLAARDASGRLRLLEGGLLGAILLADVRWAAYAGLLWGMYRLYHWASQGQVRESAGRFVASSAAQGIFALLISAPLLLPLAEYSTLSTRALLQPVDNLYLSLPPARLLTLLLPSTDGNVEWTVYTGALPLLLLIWALGAGGLRVRTRFWLGVILVGFLLALGDALPGMQIVAQLPGFDLLRVPARFILVAGLGLAGVCAYGVQFFTQHTAIHGRGAYVARLLCAGVMGFSCLTAVGVWVTTGQPKIGFVWGAIAGGLALAMITLREHGKTTPRAWLWGAVALLVLDLGGISGVNMRFRPSQAVMWEDGNTAAFLTDLPDGYRVYSPSYSLAQQTAALFKIEMANGIDPLQLRSYAMMMESASGVAQNGYSVALPPLEAATPAQSNLAVVSDAAMLGLLNVGYVVAEYAIESADLILLQEMGETRVYQNRLAFPRAWVQPEMQIPSAPDGITDVQAIHDSTERYQHSGKRTGSASLVRGQLSRLGRNRGWRNPPAAGNWWDSAWGKIARRYVYRPFCISSTQRNYRDSTGTSWLDGVSWVILAGKEQTECTSYRLNGAGCWSLPPFSCC